MAAGERLRAGGLETHSALPCSLPAALPSCGRSYKKHSPSTIGDITQWQKEPDSARCQGSYGPHPFLSMGALGKGLWVCSTRSLEGWARLLGTSSHSGGHGGWISLETFQGMRDMGKELAVGVGSRQILSVFSECSETTRGVGVGAQALPGDGPDPL